MSEYVVKLWGSDPAEGNDDCWTSTEGDGLERLTAFECFDCPKEFGEQRGWKGWGFCLSRAKFIEIVGPDTRELRPNPHYRRRPVTDDGSESEARWEAAMLHGVEGYNDAMGC